MQFDSYIFDMDGTLWDAVDSYCAVWNRTIDSLGVDVRHIERANLMPLMGMQIGDIFRYLVGDRADWNTFGPELSKNEAEMMPALGGVLYPGVRSTLEKLKARGAQLFIVSNCGARGLDNFVDYTALRPLITDFLSYGMNGLGKDRNIRQIVDSYSLKNPVYVGDTAGDCAATHAAGLPFVWAEYGFGSNVADADYKISSVSDLLTLQ